MPMVLSTVKETDDGWGKILGLEVPSCDTCIDVVNPFTGDSNRTYSPGILAENEAPLGLCPFLTHTLSFPFHVPMEPLK